MNRTIRALMAASSVSLMLVGCSQGIPASPAEVPAETVEAGTAEEIPETQSEPQASVAEAEKEEASSDTSAYEDPSGLPEYKYLGNDKYLDVINEYLVAEEKGYALDDPADVYLPYSIVVQTDETDPEDILVYGSYNISGYNLLNTTLFTEMCSYGSGVFHLKSKENGTFEITEAELPLVDEEAAELFAPIDGLYEKITEVIDTQVEKVMEDTIAEYVSVNGLHITQWQDFGRAPHPINGAAPTSEEDNFYLYESPLGYRMTYDLRKFTLYATSEDDMLSIVEDEDTGTFIIVKRSESDDPDTAIVSALSDSGAETLDTVEAQDAVIGDGIPCRRAVTDEPLEDGRIFRYIVYSVPTESGALNVMLETTWEKGVSEMSPEELDKTFEDVLATFRLS